ncbi:hypothetical protein [Legionella genomosp. 1]|uniref:hypothetical protein n=1 Tax=Legionella genomosp. 1 TaxID=1093625 RepID=UPI001056C690|nr:hypothetical protein [Legionella genomosp. 1]
MTSVLPWILYPIFPAFTVSDYYFIAAPVADLIVKRIKIIGSQQNHREYLFEALDMVSKGKVKVVAETYSLNEINKAYEKVKNGQVRFRAVVTM